MKLTIYIMFSNRSIVKKQGVSVIQLRDILDILNMGQIVFKYCVKRETNDKVILPVKRVSHEQLRNENVIFKLV